MTTIQIGWSCQWSVEFIAWLAIIIIERSHGVGKMRWSWGMSVRMSEPAESLPSSKFQSDGSFPQGTQGVVHVERHSFRRVIRLGIPRQLQRLYNFSALHPTVDTKRQD